MSFVHRSLHRIGADGVAFCKGGRDYANSFFFPSAGMDEKGSTAKLFNEPGLPKYTAETCLDGLHRIVLELRAKRFDTWAWYELAEMADEFAIEQRQADELIALAHLKERWEQVGVIPYPHQLNTAKKKLSLKCRAKPFWRMR